ncbi:MAG: hypothetical protein H6Q55_2946 [Deltaproteobacteria bacterium]|nr:hypothetical protein [Deltaproteobacteria bacterium]
MMTRDPSFHRRTHEGVMKKGATNNALKGALLSGVVFPGLGQFALKRYGRGIAFMLTTLAGVVVLVGMALQRAFTIFEKIELEGGAIDMGTVLRVATQASAPSDNLVFTAVFLALILCWIVGVVDAYRVGKKMDSVESPASQASDRKGL